MREATSYTPQAAGSSSCREIPPCASLLLDSRRLSERAPKERPLTELLMRWTHNETAARLAVLAVVTLVILGVVRLFQPYLARGIKETSTRYRTRRFANLVGYLAILIAAISIFSDQLGVLGVALGVAGAGIAFALQELVASVAGWFVIAFGRFYKVSDRIQLGGIRGDVVEIGVLRTTLLESGDWEKGGEHTGAMVRVPNSAVFKTPVHNYSADFPFLWDEIAIPIRHGSDHAFVRDMLAEVASEITREDTARAHALWRQMATRYSVKDETIDPTVTLAVTRECLEFTVRYVTGYKTRRAQRDGLFARILDEIAKNPDRVALAIPERRAPLPAPPTPADASHA